MASKWTNPKRRSFQEIKEDLVAGLTSIKGPGGKQLITDVSEGNILIIILSLFAAIAETLHFYIDNMAREAFLTTARRYSSVSLHGELVDYKPRGANAATVDVVLTRDLDGDKSNSNQKIIKGTAFRDSAGNTWLVVEDTLWPKNTTTVKVPCIQHTLYTSSALNGTKTGNIGNTITLDAPTSGDKIEHGGVELILGSTKWAEVDTFAYSKPTDNHFRLVVDGGIPTLEFGDGKFGKPMPANQTIKVNYYITKGAAGNISENAISTVPGSISTLGSNVKASNPYATADGLDNEGIELLRSHIAIHARTMAVAITKQDFIDAAKLVPGVKDAAVDYLCGRKLDLYISPGTLDAGAQNGIASSALCNKVKYYLEQNAPMTTWINVYAAGIAKINLDIEVTGKPSFTADEIKTSIENALYEAYSSVKAQIGGKVRISDIYALIDNLPEVDYLYIKKFYVSPWPTIIYGNTQLQIAYDLTNKGMEKARGRMEYLITFRADHKYNIYSKEGGYVKENIESDSVAIDDYGNGMVFGIVIKNRNSIAEGSKYSIVVSEPNMDYEEPGFNQVVFDDPNLLQLKVKEVV